MAPIATERWAIEPTLLLEAAHKIPSIVAKALQQGFGGIPRAEEHSLWATAQAIARLTEQCHRHLVLGGTTLPPQTDAQRDPQSPIGPDQEDQGEAIHRFALLAGEDPREALAGRRQGLGKHWIGEAQIAALIDE
jgi:hypothetical protein